MRKLKAAFVTNPLDSTLKSSISIVTLALASGLKEAFDNTIFTSVHREQDKVDVVDGVKIKRLRVSPDRTFRRVFEKLPFLNRPKKPFFSSQFYYPYFTLQLAQALRSGDYDLVHVHNFTQFIPLIRFMNPDIKIVLHMHSEWLTQLDPALIESRIRHADLVLGCSEFITSKIRQRYPQMADRCRTLYNGVDSNWAENEVPSRISRKKIVYVGRLSPEKGLHVLIDAFVKVADAHPEARLEIIGQERIAPKEFIVLVSDDPLLKSLEPLFGGSYLERLKSLVPSRLSDRVNFRGHVDFNELKDIYMGADVLVNPSFYESFGMTVHEAMAYGVPVVATSVGGMAETMEQGKTGVLVRPGDPEALAEALTTVLGDQGLMSRLSHAGRQDVLENFSWKTISRRLLGYYDEILDVCVSIEAGRI